MIVVGYLYNNNGMATWCLETAASLHEAGHEVLLVHASAVSLPVSLPFRTMAFDLPASTDNIKRGIIGKSKTALKMLSGKSNGFSYIVYQLLLQEQVQPKCFFLNQSDMLDKRVPVSQYLCAWAYPSGILHYITSSYKASDKNSLKKIVLNTILSLSFYRKDHVAYKNATKVLTLSPPMHQELLNKKIDAVLIPPCCEVRLSSSEKLPAKKVNLLIAALDLDNPRKNIVWMLQALNMMSPEQFTITLIGEPGENVQRQIRESSHEIFVKGIVSREEALNLFTTADIFLFASVVDDWGYVIIEAMANGLAVLVPDKTPYNYIAGNSASLFQLGNQEQFIKQLSALLQPGFLKSLQKENYSRAMTLFSRPVFAKSVSSII